MNDMNESPIQLPVQPTEGALLEQFSARARFLKKFGGDAPGGDDFTAHVAWCRAARGMAEYEIPEEMKREALKLGPIDEGLMAAVEAYWMGDTHDCPLCGGVTSDAGA